MKPSVIEDIFSNGCHSRPCIMHYTQAWARNAREFSVKICRLEFLAMRSDTDDGKLGDPPAA